MGKKPKFKREQDELERLQEEVRTLKSTNRSLMKRLKKLNKGYYKLAEEEKLDEEDIPQVVKKMCWDCTVGELIRIEVGNRYFRRCENCGKRTKTKLF